MGNQLDSQSNTHGYQDEIIQITKNRHKVWNQINGAECISDDAGNEKLCIPRRSGVARSKVKSKGLCFEMTSTLLQFCEQCHIVSSRRPTRAISGACNASAELRCYPGPMLLF